MSQSTQLTQLKTALAAASTNYLKLTNPVTHFIEWKSGQGEFIFFDKNKNSKVSLGSDIHCLVLSQMSTVRGWTTADKKKKSNALISNEVANTKTQDFVVREYGTGPTGENVSSVVVTGNWVQDIRGKFPVKFYSSLYGVCVIDGVDRLVNIRIGGTGLSSLIKAKIRPEDGFVVSFKKGEANTTGMVTYHELDISQSSDVNPELTKNVMAHYKTLNDYLNQYFSYDEAKNIDADQVFGDVEFEDADFVPAE